jgi:hypothetical protein
MPDLMMSRNTKEPGDPRLEALATSTALAAMLKAQVLVLPVSGHMMVLRTKDTYIVRTNLPTEALRDLVGLLQHELDHPTPASDVPEVAPQLVRELLNAIRDFKK